MQVWTKHPGISLNELYGILRSEFGYMRNIASLYKFLKRNGFYRKVTEINYTPKLYDTPHLIGRKWQMDVKVVPNSCRVGEACHNKYFQYTVIDEASRERFIYAYSEVSENATVDFVGRAIMALGYKPRVIQTDNGLEFTASSKQRLQVVHPFDRLCEKLKIEHKLIRAHTPRHNGKVERSHRNDQQRFYNFLRFCSLADLQNQMAVYLKRSNNTPSSALKFVRNDRVVLLTPRERRKELLLQIFGNQN